MPGYVIHLAIAEEYLEKHKDKAEEHDQYRNHVETTINHFYEKLFDLEDLMNTPAAKKEAHRRTEYMREFVQEFMDEWNV